MLSGTEGFPPAEGLPGTTEEERSRQARSASHGDTGTTATVSKVESHEGLGEPGRAVQAEPARVGPHVAAPREPASSAASARPTPGNGVLQVVQGAKRIGCAAYELQRNATRRVCGVAKPPYAATGTLDSLESYKLAEGVRYQVLYDRTALARPPQLDITTRLVAQGEQARVLHVAPTKLIMVDDEIALLPLVLSESAVESAIVVRSSAMLAALGRIFDDLWRYAAPFTAEQDLLGDARPTEEERWILSLLASGATDDTIGRLMGFSPRTAHRRVRELVTRLGVETRFQAGMQAVRLGWL